jgi:hypothetical protein
MATVNGQDLTAINNAGQIAGKIGARAVRITPVDTNGDGRPDRWFADANNDGMNDLAAVLPLPKGYSYVAGVTGINGTGDVTGHIAKTSTSSWAAAIWRGTTAAVAMTESRDQSSGYAIDIFGNLGGSYLGGRYGSPVPALWKRDAKGAYTISLLTPPAGSTSGQVSVLNDAGQALGRVYTTGGLELPVLWSRAGTPQDLSSIIPDDSNPSAFDINRDGQVLLLSREPRPENSSLTRPRAVVLTPSVPNGTAFTFRKMDLVSSDTYSVPIALSGGAAAQVVGYYQPFVSDPSTRRAFISDSVSGASWDLTQCVENLPSGASLRFGLGINDSGLILAQYRQGTTDYFCILVPNS